jgi:hypothetical protein
MKKSINININKDDQNVNDYLLCWSELEERPNKIAIFSSIDSKKFHEIINLENVKSKTISSEIYPSFGESLENRKYLIKLLDEIFISYVVYDFRSEESFVGDINIYFNSKSKESVENIVTRIESSFDEFQESNDDHLFFCLGLDNSGLDIFPVKYLEADYENIDLYFNDEVLKSIKKLSKKINKNPKGLSIIYGERGTGKSTLVSYLTTKSEKKVVFIPSTMVESAVNSFEFRNFLTKNKNIVLLIDDCENFTTDIYLKTNNFLNNLIQIVEGIDSDNFNTQVILIFNVNDRDDIEENLVDCNNLMEIIKVSDLNIEKSKELSKHLKKKNKIKKETRLIDILRKNNITENIKSIGFE